MPIWQPDTGGCWCCHHSAADHGTPVDWGMHLAAQVDELRARGSRVETIFPDSDSRNAFGVNVMDSSSVRPPLEPVTTKAEPLPSSSPNSGADAYETSPLGRRDDTC